MAGMRRLVTAAALVISAAVTSAMVVPLQLSDMVAQSDLIVRGQVVGLGSHWTPDGSTIQTDVTLQVLDVVVSREDVQEDVTFRVEGGRVGEQEVRTSVDPDFEEGDEGIFFLQFDADVQHPTLVGRSQGYLPIEGGTVTVEGAAMSVDELMSRIRGDWPPKRT
jgi:hypothetical protein